MNEIEVTRKVIELANEVHCTLGPGLLESTYRECLFYKILDHGYYAEKDKEIPLIYEGVKLECSYRVDILVLKKVVLKIKSVDHLNAIHLAQVITFMKLGDFKFGLLLNFNVLSLKYGIKKIISR